MTDTLYSFTHLLGKLFLKDVNKPARPCAHQNKQKAPTKDTNSSTFLNPALGTGPPLGFHGTPSQSKLPSPKGAGLANPHQRHCPFPPGFGLLTDLFVNIPCMRPSRE